MMNKDKINWIKKSYPDGTRVRLVFMQDEPQMKSGLMGTVFFVDDIGQVHVNWDNGITLALDVERDSFNIVS